MDIITKDPICWFSFEFCNLKHPIALTKEKEIFCININNLKSGQNLSTLSEFYHVFRCAYT